MRQIEQKDGRILLHVCCAPCATTGVMTLIEEGYDIALYFYGGNIHPQNECQLRLDALKTLAQAYKVPLYAENYDTTEWFSAISGYEKAPEGGRRCELCMKLQMENAARFAQSSNYAALCTSLTLSPQKSPLLINQWGKEIAQKYHLTWVERIWRKKNGFLRSLQESKRLSLYRQNYCGCCFSIESTRQKQRQVENGSQ